MQLTGWCVTDEKGERLDEYKRWTTLTLLPFFTPHGVVTEEYVPPYGKRAVFYPNAGGRKELRNSASTELASPILFATKDAALVRSWTDERVATIWRLSPLASFSTTFKTFIGVQNGWVIGTTGTMGTLLLDLKDGKEHQIELFGLVILTNDLAVGYSVDIRRMDRRLFVVEIRTSTFLCQVSIPEGRTATYIDRVGDLVVATMDDDSRLVVLPSGKTEEYVGRRGEHVVGSLLVKGEGAGRVLTYAGKTVATYKKDHDVTNFVFPEDESESLRAVLGTLLDGLLIRDLSSMLEKYIGE